MNERLSAASVLCFAISALAAFPSQGAECPTVSEPQGLTGEWPQQIELSEFERQTETTLAYEENPLFHAQVAEGKLPPVAERLPLDALVVMPYRNCGRYGGTLRGLSLALSTGTSELLSWRQASLVRLSDDLTTLVPNVASAWEWNDDYSEVTFLLRRGHRWSDGAPFTADDIVFYIHDIILNPQINPETPDVWLTGGSPVQVEAIDTTRVRFQFARPYPGFLHYIGTEGSFRVPFAPKHFLSQFHIDYNPNADHEARAAGFQNWSDRFHKYWARWKDTLAKTAYGVGVPTLESHVLEMEPTAERRVFVANPYYFKVDTSGRQLPYIDRHEERFVSKEQYALEIIQGNVDQKSQNMTLEDYQLLSRSQERGGYELRMTPGELLGPIQFNQTHKDPELRRIFSDLRFRQAMSFAINREEVNVLLFYGLGRIEQPLPYGVDFVTESDRQYMTEYAPEKANALLDEMGLTLGPDGRRLRPDGKALTILWEYSLQFAETPEFPKLIQHYWHQVGVEVSLKQTTTQTTRRLAQDNELDINLEWDTVFAPLMISTPQMFVPPYVAGYPGVGPPWGPWLRENGAAGEEPPQWVQDMDLLASELQGVHPSSARFLELGSEMVRLHKEHLPIIGVIGMLPSPAVVSKRLRNVTTWTMNNYSYARTYPFRPDQWYFVE